MNMAPFALALKLRDCKARYDQLVHLVKEANLERMALEDDLVKTEQELSDLRDKMLFAIEGSKGEIMLPRTNVA